MPDREERIRLAAQRRFRGTIDLTSGVGADKPGHVTQGGDSIGIELRVISLSIELADFQMLAGDYWTAPVRESIHQQGEVLLEDAAARAGAAERGAAPLHAAGRCGCGRCFEPPGASECDAYNACQLPSSPVSPICAPTISVMTTAAATCRRSAPCRMRWIISVRTRSALAQPPSAWLGRVCGLTLECDPADPAGWC